MAKNEIVAGGGSSTRGGICKYCGQVIMVEAPENWSGAEVNDLATDKCDCVEAKRERKKRERAIKAREWAEKRFSKDDCQMQAVVCSIMAIFEDSFDKITIKAGKETYKIDKDKNWMIRIQHEYKDQKREEF